MSIGLINRVHKVKALKHLGEIAIAEATDLVDIPHYKVRAKIKTGHLQGKECSLAYTGKLDNLKHPFMIRVDQPIHPHKPLIQEGFVGYFITSQVPDSFEHAQSSEISRDCWIFTAFCCSV